MKTCREYVGAMITKLRSHYDDDSGAVTIEWVVLAAALVALAVGISEILLSEDEGGVLETFRNLINDAVEGPPPSG